MHSHPFVRWTFACTAALSSLPLFASTWESITSFECRVSTGDYHIELLRSDEASNSPGISTLFVVLHPDSDLKHGASSMQYSFPKEANVTIAALTFANPNVAAQRTSDLTIDAIQSQPGTGGGERFIAALQNELLPHIKKALPSHPERIVFQTSGNGSAIAFQMLFHHPDLFDCIWLESPCMAYHRTYAMKAEYAYYRQMHTSLPRRMIITSLASESDSDSYQPLQILQRLLRSRNYSDLQFIWINGRELGIDERTQMAQLALKQLYKK